MAWSGSVQVTGRAFRPATSPGLSTAPERIGEGRAARPRYGSGPCSQNRASPECSSHTRNRQAPCRCTHGYGYGTGHFRSSRHKPTCAPCRAERGALGTFHGHRHWYLLALSSSIGTDSTPILGCILRFQIGAPPGTSLRSGAVVILTSAARSGGVGQDHGGGTAPTHPPRQEECQTEIAAHSDRLGRALRYMAGLRGMPGASAEGLGANRRLTMGI